MLVRELPDSLLAPAIDFLTEEGFEGDGFVIDFLVDFTPEAYTHLNGRKYVGETTVRRLLEALDWPTPEAYGQLLARIHEVEEVAVAAVKRAEALENVAKALETLAPQSVEQVEVTLDDSLEAQRKDRTLPPGFIAGPRDGDGYYQAEDGNWGRPPQGWAPPSEPVPTKEELFKQAEEMSDHERKALQAAAEEAAHKMESNVAVEEIARARYKQEVALARERGEL